MNGGPSRQITALGMATDPQTAPGHTVCHLCGILRSAQLRRHGGHKAHIEILDPAHKGGIGSAIGHKHTLIGQQEGYGRKLHHLFLIIAVLKSKHLHIAKTGCGSHSSHHGDIVLGRKAALLVLLCQKCAHIANGHSICGIKTAQTDNAAKIDIGHDTQQQVIHLIKTILREEQIAAPAQIIPNGRRRILLSHNNASLPFFCYFNTAQSTKQGRFCKQNCGIPPRDTAVLMIIGEVRSP